jgi:TPP-dependent trihydroxycyclohexane-1,2-dione (THcHDO) dehydratase
MTAEKSSGSAPTSPGSALAALERAHAKALRAELAYVDSLPPKASEKQYAKAWQLAAATNAARKALTEAYEAAEANTRQAVRS